MTTCTHAGTHTHGITLTRDGDDQVLSLYTYPASPTLPTREESARMTGAEWAAAMLAQRETVATARIPVTDAWTVYDGREFQSIALIDAARKLARDHMGPDASLEWLGRGWTVRGY